MTAEKKIRGSSQAEPGAWTVVRHSMYPNSSSSLNLSQSSRSSFQSFTDPSLCNTLRISNDGEGSTGSDMRQVDTPSLSDRSLPEIDKLRDEFSDTMNELTDRLNMLEGRISDVEESMRSPRTRADRLNSIVHRLIIYLKSSTCIR